MEPEDRENISPFAKLPAPNSVTVLEKDQKMQRIVELVGPDSSSRKEFAEALIEVNTEYAVEIRTATHLPLPSRNAESRPNIDYIVLFVDSADNNSVSQILSSLKYLDAAFFLGRICFIALQAPNESIHVADLSGVFQLADMYNSQLLAMNPQNKEELHIIARRIHKILEVVCGLHLGVSPLLVQATSNTYQVI